jgi:CRP-like cAMP-binding protein
MYLLGEQLSNTEPLIQLLHEYTQELLEDFKPLDDPISFVKSHDLYTDQQDTMYVVKEGFVQVSQDGRSLLHYEEGDLVGMCHCFRLPALTNRIDDPCCLIPIDRDTWLKHIYRDPRLMHIWSQYLVTYIAMLKLVLADALTDSAQPSAGYLNFHEGDVIIREGDDADQVYTIMDGHADVHVSGIKVGEVFKDEIFGAMAVFTNTPRSASIVATTSCTVMAVGKDDFLHLIKARPETCLTLIENMSRTIMSLNAQLLDKNARTSASL